MAIFDRSRLHRAAELFEERVGISVRPTDRIRQLEVRESEFAALAAETEELALHTLDYFGGRPSALRPEKRKRLAQRSRIAFRVDPLAGGEAKLLANFAFGKGVSKPTARDDAVQEVIDEAWSDPNNVEKLTGFFAQRKLSNELLTTANLFFSLYEANGRIRVSRRSSDRVIDIIPDPEDEGRPLWYLIEQVPFLWDFERDMADITQVSGPPKRLYWPHWRNVEDARAEREEFPVEGEVAWSEPPDDKTAKGVIYHVAINQLGDELFGTPPWARTLRFFSAMNVLTESHVAMAQAQASIIAKRSMVGTPNQITRSAGALLSQTGEIGTRGEAGLGLAGPRRFAPEGAQPVPPGSWWAENESDKLEPVRLDSGAGQMVQTSQIVRAPISAASQFGQHYLGDPSNTNLATASTLELPTDMNVSEWQEVFEQIFRWFTDRAIEAAVKAGRLGGAIRTEGMRPLGELRLMEAEDRAEMEKRTGKDLSYEFQMPYPGRRPMNDVGNVVDTTLSLFDPNGENIPLRRQCLRFLFTHAFELADPSHAVEEAIPDNAEPVGPKGKGRTPDPVGVDPATGQPLPPDTRPGAAPGDTLAPDQRSQYGERRKTQATGKSTEDLAAEAEWIPEELRSAVANLSAGTADLFTKYVTDPGVLAALKLEPPAERSNGAAAASS